MVCPWNSRRCPTLVTAWHQMVTSPFIFNAPSSAHCAAELASYWQGSQFIIHYSSLDPQDFRCRWFPKRAKLLFVMRSIKQHWSPPAQTPSLEVTIITCYKVASARKVSVPRCASNWPPNYWWSPGHWWRKSKRMIQVIWKLNNELYHFGERARAWT